MLYTGNVNRLIWYGAMPILAVLYFSFLRYDFLNSDDNDPLGNAHQLINITHHKTPIDGLILGGSNSLFSLSAEIFSKSSHQQWINLSLLHEGYSDKNYWNFILDVLPENRRLAVREVVYSSIIPLRLTYIKDRKNVSYGIQGENKNTFSLIPHKSMASYLKKNWLKNHDHSFLHPNPYGDFDFDKFNCSIPYRYKRIFISDLTELPPENSREKDTIYLVKKGKKMVAHFHDGHQWQTSIEKKLKHLYHFPLTDPEKIKDILLEYGLSYLMYSFSSFERYLNQEELKNWVHSQLDILTNLFPHATLYFVVPSEYYHQGTSAHLLSSQSDKLLKSLVKSFPANSHRIRFIRQSFFPHIKMICDDIHHANQEGRLWRSKELIRLLSESNK